MFDASPEEYVPWLAEAFAAAGHLVAAAGDPLSDAERARLRFHRWRLARRHPGEGEAAAAADVTPWHPDFW